MQVTSLHVRSSRAHARRGFVFLALLLVAAVLSATASAHGGGVPAHQNAQFNCGVGAAQAYPPTRFTYSSFDTNFASPEMIYWIPGLHKYTANGWQAVVWPSSWYRAFASSFGLFMDPIFGVWNLYAAYQSFSNLTPGWYVVSNWIYWTGSKQFHQEWSAMCYVR
jgi:hypothetical protein